MTRFGPNFSVSAFNADTLFQRGIVFCVAYVSAIVIASAAGPASVNAIVIATVLGFATVMMAASISILDASGLIDIVPPFIAVVGAYFVGAIATESAAAGVAAALLPVVWVSLYSRHSSQVAVVCWIPGAWLVLSVIADAAYALEIATIASASLAAVSVAIAVGGVVRQNEQLVLTDTATGALNREGLSREFAREASRHKRSDSHLCAGVITLNQLDAFIDGVGQRHASRYLRQRVRGWIKRLRITDSIARWDDRRFVILLPGCSLEHAPSAIQRVFMSDEEVPGVSVVVASWDGSSTATQFVSSIMRLLRENELEERRITIAQRA